MRQSSQSSTLISRQSNDPKNTRQRPMVTISIFVVHFRANYRRRKHVGWGTSIVHVCHEFANGAIDGRDQRRGNGDSEPGKKTRNNPRIVSRNVSIESRRFAKRICRHLASTLDSLDAMGHACRREKRKRDHSVDRHEAHTVTVMAHTEEGTTGVLGIFVAGHLWTWIWPKEEASFCNGEDWMYTKTKAGRWRLRDADLREESIGEGRSRDWPGVRRGASNFDKTSRGDR